MKFKLALTSVLLLTFFSACDQPAQAPVVSTTETTTQAIATEQTAQQTQQTAEQTIETISIPLVEPPNLITPAMTDQLAKPKKGDTIATVVTDYGTIKFKLFTKQVPEMTKNFIELTKAGKYNNIPFHRVIKDFMIQSGDFTNKNGTGGYSYKGPDTELPDQIVPSLKHLYGTVSMANAGPDTNGSQFFIVTSKDGVASLDGGYTIFGQVYEGMDVAEKIADLFMPESGGAGTPSKIVNIKKVTISKL